MLIGILCTDFLVFNMRHLSPLVKNRGIRVARLWGSFGMGSKTGIKTVKPTIKK